MQQQPARTISLLFDLFVVNQHFRRLAATALPGAGLRPDEYAVYSLLFEQGPMTATEMSRRMGMPLTTVLDYLRAMDARGHLRRARHPRDGRAQSLSLTLAGLAEQRNTHAHWEGMRERLEDSLAIAPNDVRRALHALDDAIVAALAQMESGSAAG